MDAIETLMTEHRLIEKAIDALVSFADEIRRADGDDRPELSRFVKFIREFADGCHHGKEEDILFAAMVEAGFPKQGGPIAVMLFEHDQGRQYVAALAELAAAGAPWTADDRGRLAEAAHGYGNLLRQHIHKEDAILYPMAEQRLPPDVLERIQEDCERYEEQKTGSGEPERLPRLADELLARHAPLATREQFEPAQACGAFRGCGH
jgi:hemerythrin-like domain-containing protein